ncbi:MAG: hypothetical protein AB7L71_13920 [Vicinamibacterales bacterium]|jgi:hypothetical protein
MTVRDKLEIGLKKDAEYRKDNLPPEQVRGPEVPAGEGRSPVIPAAKRDAQEAAVEHVKDEQEEAQHVHEAEVEPPRRPDDTRR